MQHGHVAEAEWCEPLRYHFIYWCNVSGDRVIWSSGQVLWRSAMQIVIKCTTLFNQETKEPDPCTHQMDSADFGTTLAAGFLAACRNITNKMRTMEDKARCLRTARIHSAPLSGLQDHDMSISTQKGKRASPGPTAPGRTCTTTERRLALAITPADAFFIIMADIVPGVIQNHTGHRQFSSMHYNLIIIPSAHSGMVS